MPITSDTPVVLNTTLDEWFIRSFIVFPSSPAGAWPLSVQFSRYDGGSTLSADQIAYKVGDIKTRMASDTDAQAAFAAVLAVLGRWAKEDSKIS